MAAKRMFEQPEALWDQLIDTARSRAGGLLAHGGAQPVVCSIVDGALVEVEGAVSDTRVAEALVQSGLIPAKTAERALSMMRTGRTSLEHVLRDLGLLTDDDRNEFDRVRKEAIFRDILLGEAPWEWRSVRLDGDNGVAVLPLLVQVLAVRAEPRDLVAWAGHPERCRFADPDDLFATLPEAAQATLKRMDGSTPLRDVLESGSLPGRIALAWLAVGTRAGWLRPPGEAAGAAVSEPAAAAAPGTTAPDAELLEVVDDELEILDDLEVVDLDAGDSERVEAAAPEPEAEAFWTQRPPADLHARLGLPGDAAGQGLVQAYSRRFRQLKVLAEEHPGDRRIETWQRAVLDAYRILNHAEARKAYAQALQRGESDPVAVVVQEMAKGALAQGIRQLRGGHPFEGGKAIQESLSWREDLPEAWVALGFFQASREDEEDVQAAAESFRRAASLASGNPKLRYFQAVSAWFSGDRGTFDADRAWLAGLPSEQLPEAWQRFLESVGEAGG